MTDAFAPFLVVQAAAGTGKTRLLTSRILRLLIEQAPPGSILAITFTRKAASEIHLRVLERLRAMAVASPALLAAHLKELGLDVEPDTQHQAQAAYERFLTSEYPMRITTFHGFCQEMLRRFPYEAGVAPGFELLEQTGELEAAAWQRLHAEAAQELQSPLAQGLEYLLQVCDGVTNTRRALQDFLDHREDWWAYTEEQPEPVSYAVARLQEVLAPQADSMAVYLATPGLQDKLQRYCRLLGDQPTASQQEFIDSLTRACLPGVAPLEQYRLILPVFLTAEGTPRVLRLNKRIPPETAQTLAGLQQDLAQMLLEAQAQQRRAQTLAVSRAWYLCGQRLLHHYQQLKMDRNLLDFTDLEWKTYRLLNGSEHMEWVQYKLDQRIDHLLVDEFQDTNPTQWRLLLPLLEEMAAGNPGRPRSVFLVGDDKQSIYRFRRADARLFVQARAWLEQRLSAPVLRQYASWRSSPAIIDCVNLVFGAHAAAGLPALLPEFPQHETHRTTLWGAVTLLPLIAPPEPQTPPAPQGLRNPLAQPRQVPEDTRYLQEGQLIAQTIQAAVGHVLIETDTEARPLDYGDILILLRERTHAPFYEQALRRAGLPYIGAGREGFLQALEVKDLLHLLRFLVFPDDDLALASALRSPLFGCTDSDLMSLAEGAHRTPMAPWWTLLQQCVQEAAPAPALARAAALLQRWMLQVDKIPVHDLLDRIFNQGNVPARYLAATPKHLKPRVTANLNRLLSLSLEAHSGRYLGLAQFIGLLETLGDDPDRPAAIAGEQGRYIRLLTIHAAKGLEAPMVFLADAARSERRERAWRSLIHWPVQAPRPLHFHLIGKKRDLDPISTQLLDEQLAEAEQEEINLLYVALTRAKQLLFVSGCAGHRDDLGWYALLRQRLGAGKAGSLRNGSVLSEDATHISYGSAPPAMPSPPAASTPVQLDPRLTAPLPAMEQTARAPSRRGADTATASGHSDDSGAQLRGRALHRMLHQLTQTKDRTQLWSRMRTEWESVIGKKQAESCWQEACSVVDRPEFRFLFDPACYTAAYNEVGLLYRDGTAEVYGVVDRLVVNDALIVVDYKTASEATTANAPMLAQAYREQLQAYAAGVTKLWPGKPVTALLLFTACCAAVKVDL